MANITRRFGRRSLALFWSLLVVIVVGAFIAYEQIALLYVSATLALVILLFIVAFADLESVGREDLET